jgi:Kef-type K+ transport system membrane component KefB
MLHWPLSKIRQPRVIAEVIAGIILGPSVMGRVPNFTDSIFPPESIPSLNLFANVGLVLFLFLVGLETNLRFLVSNWRVASSVSAAGMILPFGLGAGVSYGLYHEFHDEEGLKPIDFGTYLLFIGIAMAITVGFSSANPITSSNSLGISGLVSYPYRVETARDKCWCHRAVRRRWQ